MSFDLLQTEEISKRKYPAGSYGVFALKSIEPGTLIVVEQPFASVDSRVTGESPCHSINTWQRNGTVEYCHDDALRLINEIEKQLLIGNASWTTFEKLKLMQPIRQWLRETGHEEPSVSSLSRKQWQTTTFTE